MMIENQKNFQTYFKIDISFLRENFYSEEFTLQREWFLQKFDKTFKDQIHTSWMKFVKDYETNIPFFEWFEAYAEAKQIDHPFWTNHKCREKVYANLNQP